MGVDLSLLTPNTSIGVLTISTVIDAILLGISTLQTYLYLDNFPDDRKLLKFMVVFVFILDLVITVLLVRAIYPYIVSDSNILVDTPLLANRIAIPGCLSGVITVVVRSFFVYRIYMATQKNLYIALPFGAAGIAPLGLTIVASVEALLPYQSFQETLNLEHLLTVPSYATAAAVDVTMALIFCITLFQNSRNGLANTKRATEKIMAFSLGTGLIIGLMSVIALICITTMPYNFVWISVFMISGKVSSNSLLASLNLRKKTREAFCTEYLSTIHGCRPTDEEGPAVCSYSRFT